MATHIVPDVEAIANEVLILKEGMLIKQNTPERLTGDLYGKVWELTLSAEQKLPDVDYFQISNIQSIGDRLRIRLLAEKKPAEKKVTEKKSTEKKEMVPKTRNAGKKETTNKGRKS